MRLTGAPRRLVAALAERTASEVSVEQLRSRPWASATFTGARHCLTVHVGGVDAEQGADRLVGGLEEAEFDLGPDLLVDIALIGRNRVADGIELVVEALTIDAD